MKPNALKGGSPEEEAKAIIAEFEKSEAETQAPEESEVETEEEDNTEPEEGHEESESEEESEETEQEEETEKSDEPESEESEETEQDNSEEKPEEKPEEKEKKHPRGVQRRINRMTRRLKEAEGRALELEKEASVLRDQLQATTGQEVKPQQQGNISHLDNDPIFQQREKASEQTFLLNAQTSLTPEESAFAASMSEEAADMFKDKRVTAMMIKEHPNGPKALVGILQNEQVMDMLDSLDDRASLQLVGSILNNPSLMQANNNASLVQEQEPKPKKSIKKAPKPVRKVKTSSTSPVKKKLEDMTVEELENHIHKQRG